MQRQRKHERVNASGPAGATVDSSQGSADPARVAALLFVGGGALVLINNYLPASGHLNRGVLIGVGAASIVIGVLTLVAVPWHALPARSSIVLGFLALGIISVANVSGGVSPYSYSTYYLMVFAWIGAFHGRAGLLMVAPIATATYVLPLLGRPGITADAPWSVTVTIPVCLMMGGALALLVRKLESARAEAARHASLLEVAANAARDVSRLETRKVLAAVADAVIRLGYEASEIAVLGGSGRTYRSVETRGLPRAVAGTSHSSSSGIISLVLADGETVIVDDYDSATFAEPMVRGLGFRSVVSTPILRDGKISAVLTAGTTKRLDIDGPAVETLEILAAQAGRALEHAQAFGRERRDRRRAIRAAGRDPLSGLPNRRKADEVLATVRAGDALLLIDLDGFKQINDSLGHAVGDELIASVGDFFSQSVRGRDFCARYGGDEFLLLIRSTHRLDSADAKTFSRRLWERWTALEPLTTLSGGLAIVREDESPASAFHRADEALYRAKRSGRAHFVIAEAAIDLRPVDPMVVAADARPIVRSRRAGSPSVRA